MPGDEVELEVRDASDGQITAGSSPEALAHLDPSRANPLSGPVKVVGAKPGDALRVEILGLEGSGWGWTGIIPGFGLLSDELPGPFLVESRYDGQTVELGPGIRVPQAAFPGTLGVAPGAPGDHGVIPPRRVGGNMDFRGLVEGAVLWLPVEAPGALWSLGDTHAAQGHGEVCGTAVETSMKVRVRCTLRSGEAPRFPRFEVPPRALPAPGRRWVTTGVNSDLLAASRDAVREMIDLLMKEQGLSAELAYCLISVAGDLIIAEVVNAPNWMVVVELPTDVFR